MIIQVKTVRKFDVIRKFMVSLVVLVVQWTSLILDESSEPVHVVDGGCSSNLGSVSVTSNSSETDLVIVHEANDIIGHVPHIVRVMVI